MDGGLLPEARVCLCHHLAKQLDLFYSSALMSLDSLEAGVMAFFAVSLLIYYFYRLELFGRISSLEYGKGICPVGK